MRSQDSVFENCETFFIEIILVIQTHGLHAGVFNCETFEIRWIDMKYISMKLVSEFNTPWT